MAVSILSSLTVLSLSFLFSSASNYCLIETLFLLLSDLYKKDVIHKELRVSGSFSELLCQDHLICSCEVHSLKLTFFA